MWVGETWQGASLGCGASYRSSCRKGSELTRFGTLDGWKNSLAANSPEVLLRWKSRGVKLNFPGSGHNARISVRLGPQFGTWIISKGPCCFFCPVLSSQVRLFANYEIATSDSTHTLIFFSY